MNQQPPARPEQRPRTDARGRGTKPDAAHERPVPLCWPPDWRHRRHTRARFLYTTAARRAAGDGPTPSVVQAGGAWEAMSDHTGTSQRRSRPPCRRGHTETSRHRTARSRWLRRRSDRRQHRQDRRSLQRGRGRVIVVDTGFWIFGKKRLIPAGVDRTGRRRRTQGLRPHDEGSGQGRARTSTRPIATTAARRGLHTAYVGQHRAG